MTGLVGRHKAVTGLLVLVVVLLLAVGGWAVYLNSRLQGVPRVDAGITSRLGTTPAEHTGPLNILLAGTDTGTPGRLARLVKNGWQPGAMRSDTIMVLHVSKDRKHVSLVSIPRDSWVAIPGHGDAKINAAFSLGGPKLYVQTVQQFTGLHIDHLAVIDWGGFRKLTTALGGVDVRVPRTVYDSSTKTTWRKGVVHLEGQKALLYVRQRHGLPNGDFDRINRQQSFLRAVLNKTLSSGTLSNPVKLTRTLGAVADSMTVDQTLDTAAMRSLALSLRGVRADDLTFTTVPLLRYARIDGQSVNLVDRKKAAAMFAALEKDRLDEYLRTNDVPSLPAVGQVS